MFHPTIKWIALAVLVAAAAMIWAFTQRPVYDVAKARESAVIIHVGASTTADEKGSCSGVYLGSGLVLTARHCVLSNLVDLTSPMNDLWVETEHAQVEQAQVAYFSQDNDWALLRVKTLKVPGAAISCARQPVGAEIHVVGTPLGLAVGAVSDGKVSTHVLDPVAFMLLTGGEATLGTLGWTHLTVTTAAVLPGNSGGPVYDSEGHVVGVVVARFGDFSGYIPTSEICREVPNVG